ncbi:MAG TPA: hypothetical protein VN706_13195 [Gemmatimonadaceae bacterium]|nr:hypothetical protein [Gemmatimonadaceae bacterium]
MHPTRIGLAASALAGAAGLAAHAPSATRHAAAPLVVHEWGTITTKHAGDGAPLGCLNQISSSEALPEFVHRFEPAGLKAPLGDPGWVATTSSTKRVPLIKSDIAPCRPDVTMRLETPVIYFHPSANSPAVPPFDVRVHFRGGVLNEFYPNANASVSVDEDVIDAGSNSLAAVSHRSRPWKGARLDNSVIGALAWNGITLKGAITPPKTDAHVWLSPRAAQSAGVLTTSGEAEQYLFYRGVAHLDAVVRTQRTANGFRLLAPADLAWMRQTSMTIPAAWLLDVRPSGVAAFRAIGRVDIAKSAQGATLADVSRLDDSEYSTHAFADLRTAMHRSLVARGLFDDEASAMLETWSTSYFRGTGTRIFYLVPREWTDYFLPLDFSIPTQLTRVIVGRVDLEP